MLSHFKASFFNSTKLLLVAQRHYKFNALYPSKVKANLKTRCPKRTISDYRNDIPNNEQKSTDQNCTQSEVYKDDGLLELSEAVIENEDTDFQDNTLEPTENSNTLAAKIYNTSWYQALIARSKSQLENNQRIKIIIEDSELKEKFTRGSGNGGQKVNKTNNCVNLLHIPTGVVVQSHKTRSLDKNRQFARKLLIEKLDGLVNKQNSKKSKKIEKHVKKKKKQQQKKQKKYRLLAELAGKSTEETSHHDGI